MTKPILVIMAGGRGERFWPRSRRNYPKQLLPLMGNQSLLQAAVDRIRELTEDHRIFIVTNCDYAEEVKKQLPFLPPENILVEPEGRNTAPCMGLASVYIAKHFPAENPVVAFLPCDSMVFNPDELRHVLKAGITICKKYQTGVIFGIRPTRPETGFGYIQLGEELNEVEGVIYHKVTAFKEKPDRATAEHYLSSKEFLWNGGVFIWQLNVLRNQIQKNLPFLAEALHHFEPYVGTPEEVQMLKNIYPSLPSISVDCGILEKAQNLLVVPVRSGWDDLGSWSALERILPKDSYGNVIQGEHFGVCTTGCIIYSPKKTVTTLGIQDLIVVETDDVLLICTKDQAQEIKKLLMKLKESNREDLL